MRQSTENVEQKWRCHDQFSIFNIYLKSLKTSSYSLSHTEIDVKCVLAETFAD